MFKKIRKENNLKQMEMAKQIHCSYSHYVKLENGFVKPSFDLLLRVKIKFPTTDMNGFFKEKPAQAAT